MAFFGRGKNRVKNVVTFVDTYQDYIKDKELGSPYYVDYKTYSSLCSDYFKLAVKDLFKGKEFKMPYNIGIFRIIKKKLSSKSGNIPINWKLTNELGKKVFELNEHSKGFAYSIFWDKSLTRYSNLKCYAFEFSRYNRRELARIIKNKEEDYFEK